MTESSSPNSIQLARPVDPLTCRVLPLIDHAVAATGSRCFVAGAAARDLMLVSVFGLRPGRATRHIDFGIAVKSWDEFQGFNTVSLRQTSSKPPRRIPIDCS